MCGSKSIPTRERGEERVGEERRGDERRGEKKREGKRRGEERRGEEGRGEEGQIIGGHTGHPSLVNDVFYMQSSRSK